MIGLTNPVNKKPKLLLSVRRIDKILTNISPTLFIAIAIKLSFLLLANFLTFNLLDKYSSAGSDHSALTNYAPEVWLSLLALVLGTLIIVISIAAESTPKLIDLFVADQRSRLFIWLITLSIAENIYLQLIQTNNGTFYDNLIFLNNYVMLPLSCIIAIPYIFYILSYTKVSNVIKKIYEQNIETILLAEKINGSATEVSRNHVKLFDTINQLHDLHQFIQFKKPKGTILNRMGDSLRFYITHKKNLKTSYFTLTDTVKGDITFKKNDIKYNNQGKERLFYEQKVLRVIGVSYLLLIKDSHYDLASMCGYELYETGKLAITLKDEENIDLTLIHFNTLVRYGINHGLKTQEIRNPFNMIFHYSELISLLIASKMEIKVLTSFKYLRFYCDEASRLSLTDPIFIILVNALAAQLREILMEVNNFNFNRESEESLVTMFNRPSPVREKLIADARLDNSGVRVIQIGLCLFYLNKGEINFNEQIIKAMIRDFASLDTEVVIDIINSDCDRIAQEPEFFWEETDRGNSNMFFSAHIDQLPVFRAQILSRIIGSRTSLA